jgi:hypothetical protein
LGLKSGGKGQRKTHTRQIKFEAFFKEKAPISLKIRAFLVIFI